MQERNIFELDINPARLFAKDWAILAAGDEASGYNGMTISWGMIGSLWNGHDAKEYRGEPVCEVFVRPQRYTKRFMDAHDTFTVSFFPPEFKKALGYMGSHTGADEDKIANAGLTPLFLDGTVTFEEASLVLVCRKLYQSSFTEDHFIDKSIAEEIYPTRDLHEVYIGKIAKTLVADD